MKTNRLILSVLLISIVYQSNLMAQSCLPSSGNNITITGGVLQAGADSADEDSSTGSCGVLVENIDNSEPWSRYSISIPVGPTEQVDEGDTVTISIDAVRVGSSIGRIEVNLNNVSNSYVAYATFNANGNYQDTFTVPSNTTSLDIWLFSNYTQSVPGGVIYKNLVLNKAVAGDTTPPVIGSFTSTGQTATTIDLAWSATDDQGAVTYQLTRNGQAVTLSSTSATGHQVTGLTASTQYAFVLTALDGSANSISSSINVTTSGTGSGGESLWSSNGGDIHYTDGNVGIGTTDPGAYKLAVNGDIHTKEVRVDMQNWPDYVFIDGYKLPTLEEVEAHINDKGHLINIPSAAEVETNGIELGEMNRLLLEKIEELMLYVIEQKYENRDLEKRVKHLETTLQKLVN